MNKIYKEYLQNGVIDEDNAVDIIEEQGKEIERLNNELENVKMHYETEAEAKYYEFIDKHEGKLQQRIDKAIEYIENKKKLNYMFDYITLSKESIKELLEILKGEDKK